MTFATVSWKSVAYYLLGLERLHITFEFFSVTSPHALASHLHCIHERSVGKDSSMGIEQFCLACDKRHNSTVWYYRPSVDGGTQQWLCGIKYLLLESEDRWVWRMFPVWA